MPEIQHLWVCDCGEMEMCPTGVDVPPVDEKEII